MTLEPCCDGIVVQVQLRRCYITYLSAAYRKLWHTLAQAGNSWLEESSVVSNALCKLQTFPSASVFVARKLRYIQSLSNIISLNITGIVFYTCILRSWTHPHISAFNDNLNGRQHNKINCVNFRWKKFFYWRKNEGRNFERIEDQCWERNWGFVEINSRSCLSYK